jgi:hypothetical protein
LIRLQTGVTLQVIEEGLFISIVVGKWLLEPQELLIVTLPASTWAPYTLPTLPGAKSRVEHIFRRESVWVWSSGGKV